MQGCDAWRYRNTSASVTQVNLSPAGATPSIRPLQRRPRGGGVSPARRPRSAGAWGLVSIPCFPKSDSARPLITRPKRPGVGRPPARHGLRQPEHPGGRTTGALRRLDAWFAGGRSTRARWLTSPIFTEQGRALVEPPDPPRRRAKPRPTKAPAGCSRYRRTPGRPLVVAATKGTAWRPVDDRQGETSSSHRPSQEGAKAIRMSQWADIRHLHLVDGDVKTVRRAIGRSTPPVRMSPPRACALDPWP